MLTYLYNRIRKCERRRHERNNASYSKRLKTTTNQATKNINLLRTRSYCSYWNLPASLKHAGVKDVQSAQQDDEDEIGGHQVHCLIHFERFSATIDVCQMNFLLGIS